MAHNDLKQTLDRILSELQSSDPTRCLSAIRELQTLSYSSNAIVSQLERLAIQGNNEVQEAALNALSLKANRFIASQRAWHTKFNRDLILKEIDKWQEAELIQPNQGEVLRRRYDFDAQPISQPSAAPASAEKIQSVPRIEQPSVPTVPRPTLMQTLLSESSVKIYLYLGAFFVIASALILAAVVQAARLPILAAATLGFGGAAFVIRRRLPQPSFALFIVFSFLLPIDANVLEETIRFHEPALSIYWTFIFLLMALIWGFSIWFYASRFFSLVAFVALSLAFYRAAQIFQTETELQILFGMFASPVGLAGVFVLKRWKDNKFALPLFLLAQLQTIGLLLVSLTLVVIHVFDSEIASGWWLTIVITWIASASFFAASDILFPFFLFPWMAVAALLPLPWFFLNTFHPSESVYAIGFWIWGIVFALASEVFFRWERIKKYGWALLAGSLPLFFTSVILALDWDKPVLTFSLLMGTALVYAALHVLRPRWYVWSVALVSALFAYVVFFTLPAIEIFEVPFTVQLLGASILLTVPELLARPPLTLHNQSRLPALALGLFVSLLCVVSAFANFGDPGRAAIVFLTFAILLTLHAFHFNHPWIGYFAIPAEVLTILFALQYFEHDWWLPALTLMSVIYYAAGFFLRRADSEIKAWGPVLINSGLVLGALLSLTALALQKETAGWYMILIAAVFAVETFARPLAWLEVGVEILLSLALFRILVDFNPPNALEHVLFGVSLIWLGGDLIFSRLVEKRIHRPLTIGVGYLFVLASTIALFTGLHNYIPVTYYLIYAAFFVLYAFLQREPLLGYFTAAFIPLAVFKLYEVLKLEKWMFPFIAIAVIYYILGFVLRQTQKAKAWDITMLNSGLALGVLTSISAPFQGGLEASIPIAIVATLFAAEAFALRNVWWAIPANGLYLACYFVILNRLSVHEPQLYSIGASLLGMLMHYLLTRANSKTGAFIMGMLSQLVLLGTTYIQMVAANDLKFFFILFIQSMLVLLYGLIQRSRSLVITPIVFAVLGVVTVVYSALKGLSSVILVGCTGIVLLLLGITAVILRERITRLGEQLSDWKP